MLPFRTTRTGAKTRLRQKTRLRHRSPDPAPRPPPRPWTDRQAAKSGAVYLFERAPRRLPGLVPMRRSYRKRIVEPVLGEREIKPAVYSEKPPETPVVVPEIEKPPEERPPEDEAAEPSGKADEVNKVKDKPKK
jgi:hypothetical protein